MAKWVCESCGETFKTKRELIVDLKVHVEDYYQEMSIAEGQLSDLGVEQWNVA